MRCDIVNGDCEQFLRDYAGPKFDLTFYDPPFNQNKDYAKHADNLPQNEYWGWMTRVCQLTIENTSDGGAIYFMQREKNTQFVLEALEASGWILQNLIIWKKKTSAVPMPKGFGKHYQIIAFATKGNTARVFNKLRIDPPLLVTEKYHRPNGMYVTDVWDDIRELTSGYFAGQEPFRYSNGERVHKQQSPVELLVRIILASSIPSDLVFDPFAGTGTTVVAARQLSRNSLGIEIDPDNVSLIQQRLLQSRASDDVSRYRNDYHFTEQLNEIWPVLETEIQSTEMVYDRPRAQLSLFRETSTGFSIIDERRVVKRTVPESAQREP